MNEAIKLAIKNGGYKEIELVEWCGYGRREDWKKCIQCVIRNKEPLLDPLFWQALGRVLGWGNWSKPLEEIEHEWELDSYKADTARTPVYYCKKGCTASKIGNIIHYDEFEGYGQTVTDIKQAGYKSILASSHGIVFKESWKVHWHRFIDWIAEWKDVDKFFEELLRIP